MVFPALLDEPAGERCLEKRSVERLGTALLRKGVGDTPLEGAAALLNHCQDAPLLPYRGEWDRDVGELGDAEVVLPGGCRGASFKQLAPVR